ncbi:hypothetical protein ACMYYO_14320 [Dermacoccaceae bacterium W4C1]
MTAVGVLAMVATLASVLHLIALYGRSVLPKAEVLPWRQAGFAGWVSAVRIGWAEMVEVRSRALEHTQAL